MQKKLKKLFASIILTLIFTTSAITFQLNSVQVEAKSEIITRIFVDPPTITTTEIGETFTVNINISDVVDLFAWQAGVTFNPSVLNGTGFYQGEFLKRGGTTIWVESREINNTAGIAYFCGSSLLGPVPGVNGSGQLAYLTFEAAGLGTSNFHLTDVLLVQATELELIEFVYEDVFTAAVNAVNYDVKIANNMTGVESPEDPPASGLFKHSFNQTDKEIGFDVVTKYDTYYNITIPKSLLRCNLTSEWIVKVDGEPVPFTPIEGDTYTSLYLEHHNGTHEIEIVGTEVGGLLGDLNSDDKVDMQDVGIVALPFGSYPGHPRWNPVADINNDNKVDMKDVSTVAKEFGKTL